MSPAEQHEDDMIIDTSKMSEGKRAALEIAEHSRDKLETGESFCASLFLGKYNWSAVYPYPAQPEEDKQAGAEFLGKLETFLRDKVDADEIDATGEIPDEILKELADMGAFGIKVSKEYKGLGLSQTNYCRAGMLLGSVCGNLTAMLSAHQSIGIPQPLISFGTEEQKQKYLPRVAQGEISAFALTEEGVGSDPARMETLGVPNEDKTEWTINGSKLWCTNVVKAGVIIVMAKTPSKVVRGKERSQITAFIVETNAPGVKIETRCRFMGLKALYNGVVSFTDVKVPAENIVGGEGRGLKVALSTLNTGRLTIPAACAGLNRKCIQINREWAGQREQWGAAIGKHAAIADKIGKMAASNFASEAMTFYTASLVDQKRGDIRLEAAVCKMWGTEDSWHTVDETMQIRGGRGFETAHSLKSRGSKFSDPIERWMRDSRINLIFEGSSEIMRLFIAREALDPHLKTGGAVLNSQLPTGQRVSAAMKAAGFYALWYPKTWMPAFVNTSGLDGRLAKHIRYSARTSKKLARALFHAMMKHQAALEQEQIVLKQIVDIGAELFAISAACSRAQHMHDHEKANGVIELADTFCVDAKLKIAQSFKNLKKNNNKGNYKLAQAVLNKEYAWMEDGIVN